MRIVPVTARLLQMKILITGGAGFIGKALTAHLLQASHHVTVLNRAGARLEGLQQQFPGLPCIAGLLSDEPMVRLALADASTVIHLAHSSIPANVQADPQGDLATNLPALCKLMELARQHKVCRFIFVSSGGTVYGQAQYLPITEDHPTVPISAYGASKLAMEHYVRLLGSEYGLETIIVRLANPYGPGKLPGTKQGVIPEFIRSMRANEPIEIWGDGRAIRDYIHLDEVCTVLMRALEQPLPAQNFIFNLGTGIGTSLNELIAHLESILGRKARIIYRPGRTIDVSANVLSIARLREWIGFESQIDLNAGLKRMVAALGDTP